MSGKPAIVAIGYNRPDSLVRLLRSLAQAKYETQDITLIISIDHASSHEEVEAVANAFVWEHGPKIVNPHAERLGLRAHVLECGDYAHEYGAVIILEDDIFVAPYFYSYTVAAQKYYEAEDRVAGIGLYTAQWNSCTTRRFSPRQSNGDVFFSQFGVSWGQSWSAKQWASFKEWYAQHPALCPTDKIQPEIYGWPESSWGKYFQYYLVETDRYYVIPYRAQSTCFSDVGQHTAMASSAFQTNLDMGKRAYTFVPLAQGMHYDTFFESMDLQPLLDKFTGGQLVRIDLYGKHLNGPEEYVLTTRALKGERIAAWGLVMRPMEANVIWDVPGNEIGLYKVDPAAPQPKKEHKTLYWELAGYSWRECLRYGFKLAAVKGRAKLKRGFKKLARMFKRR